MNIVINILQYLIPIFIRFIDKHSDEFLENLYHKISLKLEDKEMSTVKFIVYDITGKKINNAKAAFKYDILGDIEKSATEDGSITISGLKNAEYEFIITSGNKQNRERIIINKDNSYIERIVVLNDYTNY